MLTNSDAIFKAALALPLQLRDDLAAKLLESVVIELGPPDDRTPEDWVRIIMERSDELHRNKSDLIEGEVVVAKLQTIIDRASAKS